MIILRLSLIGRLVMARSSPRRPLAASVWLRYDPCTLYRRPSQPPPRAAIRRVGIARCACSLTASFGSRGSEVQRANTRASHGGQPHPVPMSNPHDPPSLTTKHPIRAGRLFEDVTAFVPVRSCDERSSTAHSDRDGRVGVGRRTI